MAYVSEHIEEEVSGPLLQFYYSPGALQFQKISLERELLLENK